MAVSSGAILMPQQHAQFDVLLEASFATTSDTVTNLTRPYNNNKSDDVAPEDYVALPDDGNKDNDNNDDNDNDNNKEEEQLLAWLRAQDTKSDNCATMPEETASNLQSRFLQLFPSAPISDLTLHNLTPSIDCRAHIPSSKPHSTTEMQDVPSPVIMTPQLILSTTTITFSFCDHHMAMTLHSKNSLTDYTHVVFHHCAATTIPRVWHKHAIQTMSRPRTSQPCNNKYITSSIATLLMPDRSPTGCLVTPCNFCTSSTWPPG